MDSTQKGIITLLKSAVTQQSLPISEDFDLEAAAALMKRHQCNTLLYDGAVRCGFSRDLPVMQKLFRSYCKMMQISVGQMQMLEQVLAAFEANGIDYMPLKGSNLKALYPQPELRVMGDADVLIRIEQRKAIKKVMESLGFSNTGESDYEYVWQNQQLYLELHKRLVPSYDQDFYRHLGDGWRLARQQEGCHYAMSPEDELIFLFTHFTKHYRDGGIGCRQVVDLYVYLRAYPELDEAYICQELDKLYLLTFYDNIRHLLDVWFADAPVDEITEHISQFVFGSGNWGNSDSRVLSFGVRDQRNEDGVGRSRLAWLRKVMFPELQAMRKKYTVLNKAPWLLPAVWVVRPFYKLLFERRDVMKRKNQFHTLNRENLEKRKQSLKYVGLDYHF